MELDKTTVQRILKEFEAVDLGDARRSKRLSKLVADLAAHPALSLPDALADEVALEGAYRLLNNEAFDFDDVLEAHREQTIARAEQSPEVLVLHDTTVCHFEHADPREVGYLSTGKAGFLAHLGLVVDATRHRRPLGVLHVEPLWRTRRSKHGGRKKHSSGHEVARWKNREAERWIRGVQSCQEQLDHPSVVHVMDREGDKYELLAHMQEHEEHFVVRSTHDRQLSQQHRGSSLREVARQQPVMFQRDVHLSRRVGSPAPRARHLAPTRQARAATLSVTATSVVVRRPRSLSKELPDSLTLNVVHVQEVHPPRGTAAVVWTLLTSEPVDTPEQVARVIDIYRYRWLIEELFKALKSGCAFEQRQFETRHALLNMLAVSLPIAVEVLWLRGRVADEPGAPGEEVATAQQIEVLRAMGRRPVPHNPTALDVLLAIAGLGGHLKRNGTPGWQVLHRGFQRLLAYEAGWVAGRSAAKRRNL